MSEEKKVFVRKVYLVTRDHEDQTTLSHVVSMLNEMLPSWHRLYLDDADPVEEPAEEYALDDEWFEEEEDDE